MLYRTKILLNRTIVSDTPQNLPAATDMVRAYHARTKHRFSAYAEGPGQLDWDAQPAPFRHYPGAPRVELPLAANRFERPYRQLARPPAQAIAADLASLGALLELALGLSAWKSWGSSRWALRCNPSSGNLHPVEAYVLSAGLPGIPHGLHHYDPEQHALEVRAQCAPGAPGGPRWLALGLSSVMWREAWKYGERAFRYCQLDVGHALGTVGYAAALLGWRVEPLRLADDTLAHCLGIDRTSDFPPSRSAFTEREEPEILLALHAPGLDVPPDGPQLADWLASASWHGQPTRIDPDPGYRWPAIDQAAVASRLPADPQPLPGTADTSTHYPPLAPHPSAHGAAHIIRQRRSGQRFDPQHSLPKAAFYRLLDATLPRPGLPFGAQEAAPHIHLLLFVLRVDGLVPGLYLLPRTAPPASLELSTALAARFPGQTRVADAPAHLGLIQLAELGLQELQGLARTLSCHQDIASTSAFSLGMLGEFDTAMATHAHGYRELLREAGLIGQVLYLEAEAAGVRGTGIGCFFDDPVHDLLGLADSHWQSVYHFTVGTPVVDERIETTPPYPQRKPQSA